MRLSIHFVDEGFADYRAVAMVHRTLEGIFNDAESDLVICILDKLIQ